MQVTFCTVGLERLVHGLLAGLLIKLVIPLTRPEHHAKLGTVCATPGNIPMSKHGWQCSSLVREDCLTLPPKLKVQAKLGYLGELSFPSDLRF